MKYCLKKCKTYRCFKRVKTYVMLYVFNHMKGMKD